MIRYFTISLILLHAAASFADVSVNPNNGTTNVHYNRSNRRLIRINDTIIVLAPEGSNEVTYRSTNGGTSWSSIDSNIAFSGCLITGPDNYVYHFFRSGTTLRMVKYLYDAVSIPSPVTILSDSDIGTSSLGAYRTTSATVDSDGTLFVADNWVNSGDSANTIYMVYSTDNGDNWSSKIAVSANSPAGTTWYNQELDCMTDDTLVVTYNQQGGESGNLVMCAISSNYGSNWTRHQVNSADEVGNVSLLTVDDDTIYIFAQMGSEGATPGLVFSKSTDTGTNWSSWTLIDSTCGYGDPSAALASNGNIYVVYRSNNYVSPPIGSCGDQSRCFVKYTTDGGSNWSTLINYTSYERVGTKNHMRYQTHHNYGGDLSWIWLQYTNSETDHETYYDSDNGVSIAQVSLSVPLTTKGITVFGGALQ